MNSKQKAKAIKLLSKDCKIRHFYIDGEDTCAIGCLALAARVGRKLLKKADGVRIAEPSMAFIRSKIRSMFGLSSRDMDSIQDTNDNYVSSKDRRAAVVDYIERL